MAEETLVKESLTPDMITGGAELTRRLDEAKWQVTASLWVFDLPNNLWRLILASPFVKTQGPIAAYTTIQSVLLNLKATSVTLNDIAVVPPDDPLVKRLASVIQTGSAISGVRFSRNAINGHFIEDAYIYRVNPA